MDLNWLTLKEARQLLQKSEISPEGLLEAIFEQIEKVEPEIKAFVTITKDEAFERLQEIKDRRQGLLWCLPLAIKDNICTRGIRTTCSSRILQEYVPPYESTVTGRLLKEGYILVGKTNMDEFAMGSSTENSGFFPTRNPWNRECVPGGSSGGSAAAVAAGMCLGALGSDTGGSIRQPAAFCGVVGLKPTYGRVSRFGLVAFASSLDQIGPITRTVEDAALLLKVISGHDPKDSTSVNEVVPEYLEALEKPIKGLKVGLPVEYFTEGLSPEVEKAVREVAKLLESLGCECKEVSLPHTKYSIATYYLIATSEASSNLARYDGVKYGLRAQAKDLLEMYMETRSKGFGPEVKRRIMLGTYALSAGYYEAYYGKALQVRTLIKGDFEDAFKEVDVILTPTTPTPAFRFGEKTEDPLQMYLSDIFTNSVNLAGLPAISIPAGFSSEGLPIGAQFIGRAFDEETILRVSHHVQKETDWHKRRPSL
ncbi:MAG: Asp-tRNA(Asn)/Glu-tRNA(Gln) amidotransferase subunit GatA [Nitrospirae bacterium]|nr:MAG: Asp-tRNA(Asn)/Glu-tRNA(Gln) amidotransferase subunit GatA [Nitrospirota bacterium]